MNKNPKFGLVILALAVLIAVAGIWLYRENFSGIFIVRQSPVDLPGLIEKKPASIADLPLELAEGFEISVYAKDLPGARVMLIDPAGNMLVSQTKTGRVVALTDNGRGEAKIGKLLADRLREPHGLAVHCGQTDEACRLYIAEENQVAVYDYDMDRLVISGKKKIIDLPAGAGHSTRTLLLAEINGKEKLLVSIGSSCNVCSEKDARRASIYSADLDGGDFKLLAKGLRNAVFMAKNPQDGKIWATEMGRDNLGDTWPPDEINIIEEGRNYGWPICYGKNIHDTVFDKNTYIRNPCQEPFETSSFIDIPAHNAPLGLAFFPSEGWPEDYKNDALVALHGSWNSSVPVGYKIIRIKLDDDSVFTGSEDFITGLLTPDKMQIGRPVDIIIRPDRTIFFSDDSRGVIYKVSFKLKAADIESPLTFNKKVTSRFSMAGGREAGLDRAQDY